MTVGMVSCMLLCWGVGWDGMTHVRTHLRIPIDVYVSRAVGIYKHIQIKGSLTLKHVINPLTPNDLYMSRIATLTSKRCILYIYSTNVDTEYFKHALYPPVFFPLQNAVCFIMLTCLVPVLFTFYIQVC